MAPVSPDRTLPIQPCQVRSELINATMDEMLFLRELNSERVESRPEATKWLEILNFPASSQARTRGSDTEPNALNEGGFLKFLVRQPPFPTTSLGNVTSGIRLLYECFPYPKTVHN